jgi:hypothetical protein
MANEGIDMINMKRFGGWKSEAAVEGYIAESVTNKKKLAMSLTGNEDMNNKENSEKKSKDTDLTDQPAINVAACSNCTITFNFNK